MGKRDDARLVLLTFGERPPAAGTWDEIKAHRWAFSIGWWSTPKDGRGVYLSIDQENLHDGKWVTGSDHFTASVTRAVRWGSDHWYYDGPQCSFSLGPLHLSWSYWWCKRCMPD